MKRDVEVKVTQKIYGRREKKRRLNVVSRVIKVLRKPVHIEAVRISFGEMEVDGEKRK